MLIRGAELNGNGPIDLRCQGKLIAEIGTAIKPYGDEVVIEARGGMLLPGLHDHHIHLYSLAATHRSVICGPPQVNNLNELSHTLHQYSGSNESLWIRGIGYHDSVAGPLDRWQMDKLVRDRPLRVQHRSGKMWILNSLACESLQLDEQRNLEGIERDQNGLATGRLFRMDSWLRDKLGGQDIPELADVSRLLASFGVTGITDATPTNSASIVTLLKNAANKKQLLQRVLIMGDAYLPEPDHPLLTQGALKILLDDHQLPEFEPLKKRIEIAHKQQRPVAIHCVTQTELIFALTALIEAGKYPGDRIEHASLTPVEALPLMRQAGITVVTQPGFIKERGDQYRADIDLQDQPLLYRCRNFLEAGIPLGGSTDAPYGDPDPWSAMRTAVERRTASGHAFGEPEKLSPEQALVLFTSPPETPGVAPRVIEVGATADLCLLDRGWAEARKRLSSSDVRATIRDGELIYCRTS